MKNPHFRRFVLGGSVGLAVVLAALLVRYGAMHYPKAALTLTLIPLAYILGVAIDAFL